MDIKELINRDRRKGDIALIASIVGCSERTVKSYLAADCVKSKRNFDTRTGKRVQSAFKLLLEQRQELKKLHAKVA